MNRVRLYHRAQQLLPAVVETSGLQRFAMSPGQLQCLLFGGRLRCESQGDVVLALSRPAAAAIARAGLAYFDGATTSRGVLASRGRAHYEAWQWSPLPDASGTWEDAWQEGAYYTRDTRGGAWLVVLPTEGLVVYRWAD